MNYGYIRVSSDKQTVENQRFEIENFAKQNGFKIDGWIEETISGMKSYDKRQLGKLLNRVKKDDLIICSELSRLGRNLFIIMGNALLPLERTNKISLFFNKYSSVGISFNDILGSAEVSVIIEKSLKSPTPKQLISTPLSS